MQTLLSLIGVFITIFFVIGTHESAHFFAARCLGVKVLRFSIGFGKTLLSWHDKSGTEYVLALIPLGGYVKMLDDTEEAVPLSEKKFTYNRQAFYKKFLIILAGPAANFLCAFLLYWIIFLMGFDAVKPIIGNVQNNSIAFHAHLAAKQEITSIDSIPTPTWTAITYRLMAHAGNKDSVAITVKDTGDHTLQRELDLTEWHMDDLTPEPLTSLGIIPFEPEIPTVIAQIAKHSPADKAGLKISDKLLALNSIPVNSWQEFMKVLAKLSHPNIQLKIQRGTSTITLPITLETKTYWFKPNSYYLGISPKIIFPRYIFHKIQHPPIEAIQPAWQELKDFTILNFVIFQKIIMGKISLQSLGGPISIFQGAGTALNFGLISFLSFLAFLSISIGVLNVLPIPGLDGGHLLFLTLESITQKPISIRTQALLFRLGFALIIFVMLQAVANDLMRFKL